MKKRILIALILSLLTILFLPTALVVMDLRGQVISILSSIVVFVIIGVYVFGGVPKMIVYVIYGAITSLFLFVFEEPYHLPIVFIGTLLFVLHPLSTFEDYLASKMLPEDVLPIRISIHGSYWPFYAYFKEMKNFYHLPQARKLYTKKTYLHLRQFTTIMLLFAGIFLYIHGISFIANSLDDFSWFRFFIFYAVIIVFILAFYTIKKGFTSTFRTLVISLFPPMIYLILVSTFPDVIKYSFAGSVLVLGIVISIVELTKYYQRVAYDSYHYYDVDQQLEVFANALFEPLVYNESFTKCGHFQIKVKLETFQKHFHDILVYANFFRFIITAYAFGKECVHVYADFHEKNEKRAEKFKVYLEAKFKMAVPMDLIDDPNKSQYEKKFFHRPNYIIARAQNLANLLKELEIRTKIIISIIAYFELEEEFEDFQSDFSAVRLDDLSEEAYITARIDVPSVNVDYMIESKIREVLLSLMVHHGQFVRISVYY
jgi:hypothetical protein